MPGILVLFSYLNVPEYHSDDRCLFSRFFVCHQGSCRIPDPRSWLSGMMSRKLFHFFREARQESGYRDTNGIDAGVATTSRHVRETDTSTHPCNRDKALRKKRGKFTISSTSYPWMELCEVRLRPPMVISYWRVLQQGF